MPRPRCVKTWTLLLHIQTAADQQTMCNVTHPIRVNYRDKQKTNSRGGGDKIKLWWRVEAFSCCIPRAQEPNKTVNVQGGRALERVRVTTDAVEKQ